MELLTLTSKVKGTIVEDRFKSFDEMYIENHSRIYRYIHYRVRDDAIAEDLTSQTFERALTRLDLFDADKGAFSTWLFSIARRIIANYYRAQDRRPAAVFLADEADIEDPGSNPEENYLERDQQRMLHKNLMQLPEKDQEIIALKFGASLTNREIGKVIGMSESNVGTTLHRAVQKMRTIFQKEGWVL
jgi:RNA polymerase sigma-70 factor, ECF subfamily